MMKRILLAGILGGIAMFIWTSLAHVVLPLGEIGVQEIPGEPAVLSAMQTSLGTSSGLYFFPGTGLPPGASREQRSAAMKEYGAKLANHPSGILIYHPPGVQPMSASQLIAELLKEILQSLIVVFLLAQTRLATFSGRVGFITLAGIMAAVTTNVSYWNWYGFPANYTAAYMFIEIIGYAAAGCVAALLLKKTIVVQAAPVSA